MTYGLSSASSYLRDAEGLDDCELGVLLEGAVAVGAMLPKSQVEVDDRNR